MGIIVFCDFWKIALRSHETFIPFFIVLKKSDKIIVYKYLYKYLTNLRESPYT